MISNSFLLDFFKVIDFLITELSKKYNPVIAKFDLEFLGFSFKFIIKFSNYPLNAR